MRIERLLSVLKEETKRAAEGIGTNGILYWTALKLLKTEFGNPLMVCHLKMKKLFEELPMKGKNPTSFAPILPAWKI